MNRMVLIADGNTGRGQRLAEACERAGVACKTGAHGAAALEMALADRPGLVVAQLDLPLVDAVKLAEILRANPRTRRSRFLFIGEDAEGAARLGGPGDMLLPPGVPPSDIVCAIEDLIERQDRLEALDLAAENGEVVSGELGGISVADLITLFQANRASGRFDLERDQEGQRSERGLVWLRDGDVLQAEAGRTMGEKALFRLLAWTGGSFRFAPGAVDEPAAIAASTRALLQEGLRQLQEWDRLATKLPPLDSPVKLRVGSADLPNIVHPLTQEVLLLLELYATVREVVDHCSFPDYQVLRTLRTLEDRELVEVGRVPVSLPVREAHEGLFNDAQLRRLREWTEAGSSGDLPPPAKLLIASSDPVATPDFANLIRGIPGVTLTLEMARGELGPDDLAPIGRLELSEGLSIELIHVPWEERFAPLWPLAGHHALGTLFLMSGPVSRAAETLAPMCEALAQQPRARTFHVVLLRKGERISPDELRDNLALIDEASLFLLPLESGKEPVALLRGLFSRIVP